MDAPAAGTGRAQGLTPLGRDVVQEMNRLGMLPGLSESDVARILGGNFLRLFEDVEPPRATICAMMTPG